MSTVSTNKTAVDEFMKVTGAKRAQAGTPGTSGLCDLQGFSIRVKGVTTPTVSGVHPLNGEPLVIRYEADAAVEWYVVPARWILEWADGGQLTRRHMCAHAFDCCQFSIPNLMPSFRCKDPSSDSASDLTSKALAEGQAAASAKWMVDIMSTLHEKTTSSVCSALSQLVAGPPAPIDDLDES